MEYKGYQGIVTYDEEAEIFHGRVVSGRSATPPRQSFNGAAIG